MLDIHSYPQYIHTQMQIPPPSPSTKLYPSGMNGSTGFVCQFMKPTTATSANASSMSTESIVLTLPTSLSPIRLMMVNISIIPILTACSAAVDIGIICVTYPATRATYTPFVIYVDTVPHHPAWNPQNSPKASFTHTYTPPSDGSNRS